MVKISLLKSSIEIMKTRYNLTTYHSIVKKEFINSCNSERLATPACNKKLERFVRKV